MKRINSIIESEFAPASKNDMWLFKGSLKYFGPSGWANIQAAIEGSVDWDSITNKPNFATVATSGSYNDLSDKPTIPPAYTLPAATKTTLGGIKAGTNIANLAVDADLATVIGTVNSILTQLRTARVLI